MMLTVFCEKFDLFSQHACFSFLPLPLPLFVCLFVCLLGLEGLSPLVKFLTRVSSRCSLFKH